MPCLARRRADLDWRHGPCVARGRSEGAPPRSPPLRPTINSSYRLPRRSASAAGVKAAHTGAEPRRERHGGPVYGRDGDEGAKRAVLCAGTGRERGHRAPRVLRWPRQDDASQGALLVPSVCALARCFARACAGGRPTLPPRRGCFRVTGQILGGVLARRDVPKHAEQMARSPYPRLHMPARDPPPPAQSRKSG